jgi:hypothetical protein
MQHVYHIKSYERCWFELESSTISLITVGASTHSKFQPSNVPPDWNVLMLDIGATQTDFQLKLSHKSK